MAYLHDEVGTLFASETLCHLFDIESKNLFHVHRNADEDRIVRPVVTAVSRYYRPYGTRRHYLAPRYTRLLVLLTDNVSNIVRRDEDSQTLGDCIEFGSNFYSLGISL